MSGTQQAFPTNSPHILESCCVHRRPLGTLACLVLRRSPPFMVIIIILIVTTIIHTLQTRKQNPQITQATLQGQSPSSSLIPEACLATKMVFSSPSQLSQFELPGCNQEPEVLTAEQRNFLIELISKPSPQLSSL